MLKSIVCTYPGFRELPKGIKQMLVVSEDLFFEEAQSSSWKWDAHDAESNREWAMSQKPLFANSHHVLVA